MYWKSKFLSAQSLIEETHERSLQLGHIPGLLTIKKIKAKKTETNIRVTQVCGSMEGKNILQVVKSIKDKKAQKAKAQVEKENQKLKERESFYRCKERCICQKPKCEASGLNECSSCHNIIRSNCGKAACRKNGECPIMINSSAVVTNARKSLTQKFQQSDESDEDVNDYTDEDEMNEGELEDEEESVICDELEQAVQAMKDTWRFVSPPNEESNVVGKWHAVCYQGKKSINLFVEKANYRFIEDKNGPVDNIIMTCLKPKVGSGNLLEDTPKHLPADEAPFDMSNIIAGPLEVIPKGPTHILVPCYEDMKCHFELVKNIDRASLALEYIVYIYIYSL